MVELYYEVWFSSHNYYNTGEESDEKTEFDGDLVSDCLCT